MGAGGFSAYGWVEETTSNAEKDPSVDGQRETEAERNVEQVGGIGRRTDASTSSSGVGDLRDGKREEEKHEGADEFTNHRYKMVAESLWKSIDDRDLPHLL